MSTIGVMRTRVAGAFVTVTVILGVTAILLTYHFTKTHEKLPDTGHPLGWVAVGACLFTFGSYGIFVKTPSVSDLNVDPAVFQVYNSLGTAATLMCVAFYNTVHFTASEFLWGVLGASFWVITQLLAFVAINTIGCDSLVCSVDCIY
jgi:hypothetical protein